MRAYLICRNFSVNDGMYPAGHDHGGIVQGVPVAIGKGRKCERVRDEEMGFSGISDGVGGSSPAGSWSGSGSGGSSPERRLRYDV